MNSANKQLTSCIVGRLLPPGPGPVSRPAKAASRRAGPIGRPRQRRHDATEGSTGTQSRNGAKKKAPPKAGLMAMETTFGSLSSFRPRWLLPHSSHAGTITDANKATTGAAGRRLKCPAAPGAIPVRRRRSAGAGRIDHGMHATRGAQPPTPTARGVKTTDQRGGQGRDPTGNRSARRHCLPLSLRSPAEPDHGRPAHPQECERYVPDQRSPVRCQAAGWKPAGMWQPQPGQGSGDGSIPITSGRARALSQARREQDSVSPIETTSSRRSDPGCGCVNRPETPCPGPRGVQSRKGIT